MGLNPRIIYLLTIVGFCFLQIQCTSGLSCFYCADTGEHPECQDHRALKKSASTNGSLIRDCTNNEKYCMTEKFAKKGVVYSYIRDCMKGNDGFSFNRTGRLKYLQADNVTVCTFDMESLGQKCISLCDSDLCNGPSGADSLLLSEKLLGFTLLWWFKYFF